eukprot:TRINITY_DN3597_c0_g4_i2.p2 TRINITY_DN3597_c0_g4~~TRINITY_DN3597_c0_g4_i2.p2  ORF type:complete len:203 (-),score=55.90 TRINITY_DN3597_c0_g4_i2:65-673(-)
MYKKSTKQSHAIELIRIMRAVVSKCSGSLNEQLPAFGDIILRGIDLINDVAAKELIENVGQLINVMLMKYPFVAFHRSSDYFAVGTAEGLIIIYALKQNQRLKTLEGHTAPISALAFTKDGKRLVSYSAAEGAMRVWVLKSGPFSFMKEQSRSTVVGMDKHQKKSRIGSKSKEEVYPRIEFGKGKSQVNLYLSYEEAYAFTI